MEQLLQSLKDGSTYLTQSVDLSPRHNHVLIDSTCSLVSPGTERMLVSFGKSGILGKIKQQPDKVKMVMDKVSTDGIKATYESVMSKLDEPIPLGYSNVGIVRDNGGISHFNIGDRVVSNGHHSSQVLVPRNLVSKIPENVSDEEASFTVLGAIAMQGVRISKPELGETFVVSGLGVIGLLTTQILLANGCRVIATDFCEKKLMLAEEYGAVPFKVSEDSNLLDYCTSANSGNGVDGVIICASSRSDTIISQSAQMCRKRGRITLVGVVGLNLDRSDFYEKEIKFQVSCSYGPGRYEDNYEDKGLDYPIGYVRWTENRNFESFLDLLSRKKVDVKKLITVRKGFKDIPNWYSDELFNLENLGVIIEYGNNKAKTEPCEFVKIAESSTLRGISDKELNSASMIGLGAFASKVLAPSLLKTGFSLNNVLANGGGKLAYSAKKKGFNAIFKDKSKFLSSSISDLLIIATRHNSHAGYVLDGIKNNQHIFVEKPLCLTHEELEEIKSSIKKENFEKTITVGFNRRFSKYTEMAKKKLNSSVGPIFLNYNINAGKIPQDHWIQDSKIGGGRLIGEGCHFVDLAIFLIGKKVISTDVSNAGSLDSYSIRIKFEDGSLANINYHSLGSKKFSKENIQISFDEKTIVIDNFKSIKGYGLTFPKNVFNFNGQDKGHVKMFELLKKSISEQKELVSLNDSVLVSEICINLNSKLSKN